MIDDHNIQDTRIRQLNDLNIRSDADYVLYWMQQSQRAEVNHALEYAVLQANHLDLGVVVVFGITDDYLEANLRHYTFMLEGLMEIKAALEKRGIQMVVRRGPPPDVALELGQNAAMIVCDRGYLKHQRKWRDRVARKASCRVVRVESDVVVPLETVSPKAEYAARTIRPKIQKHLYDYLNSYAGVAWIFGVHDRAWPQRPIYGKVRCMMASGLERKCDIHAYVNKVNIYIEKSKSFVTSQ